MYSSVYGASVTYISVHTKDSVMFGWLDYVIFALCLGIPLIIGIYFGFIKKKNNSTKEYLYGIGKMSTIPVGLSLYSRQVFQSIYAQMMHNTHTCIPVHVYLFILRLQLYDRRCDFRISHWSLRIWRSISTGTYWTIIVPNHNVVHSLASFLWNPENHITLWSKYK